VWDPAAHPRFVINTSNGSHSAVAGDVGYITNIPAELMPAGEVIASSRWMQLSRKSTLVAGFRAVVITLTRRQLDRRRGTSSN
jgi:hypothetical protein